MVEDKVGVEGQTQEGYSLQNLVRESIWSSYERLSADYKELLLEKVRNNGQVKVKTALKSLNDLYAFMEDSGLEVKNARYYSNSKLKEVEKFVHFYFEPQLKPLVECMNNGDEFIVVGSNGFSLRHFGNWKRLGRYFLEVSGIAKFERVMPVNPESGFGAV